MIPIEQRGHDDADELYLSPPLPSPHL